MPRGCVPAKCYVTEVCTQLPYALPMVVCETKAEHMLNQGSIVYDVSTSCYVAQLPLAQAKPSGNNTGRSDNIRSNQNARRCCAHVLGLSPKCLLSKFPGCWDV